MQTGGHHFIKRKQESPAICKVPSIELEEIDKEKKLIGGNMEDFSGTYLIRAG